MLENETEHGNDQQISKRISWFVDGFNKQAAEDVNESASIGDYEPLKIECEDA